MKKSTHWERNREAAVLDQANIEQEQQQRQSDEVRKRSTEGAEGNVMTTVDIFTVPLVCSRFRLTAEAWPGAAAAAAAAAADGAGAGGPGTQHLVISQSAAAHQKQCVSNQS